MSTAPARCGESGRIASHIWLAHEGESYSVCRLCGAVRNNATPASGPRVDLPTLHAIGLAPQLAELERICAESQRGKHAGESIFDVGWFDHRDKAHSHIERDACEGERDADSGARHLIHAAARLLMTAACIDKEGL